MPRRGRFGLRTYARILALITKQPMTQWQVAAAIDAGVQTAREILWMMVRQRLAYVVRWDEPDHPTRKPYLAAVFAAGEGESAPYPVPLKRSPLGSGVGGSRTELIHFAAIVRELREGATRSEIHERCGTMYHNLGPLLQRMRELGIAHVAAWQPREGTPGLPSQVWQMGGGPDARRPPRKPLKQRQRDYRERQRVRKAQMRLIRAIAGQGAIVATGVQSYQLGTTA